MGKPDFEKKHEISAMIIDDEPHAISSLKALIAKDKRIRLLAVESDVSPAIRKIIEMKPELLFLDIQMPKMSGFELLRALNDAGINPYVIFVTAYNTFAIEAIRHSALDYLLKPIDPLQLTLSLERFFHLLEQKKQPDYHALLSRTNQNNKIQFNILGGYILVDYHDIVYIKADWNYSIIHYTKDKTELITSTLGFMEEILQPYPFCRISRSVIINLNYLVKVKRLLRKCYLVKDEEEYEFSVSVARLRDMEKRK
jgi:two-component system, LytTR family, response regulator